MDIEIDIERIAREKIIAEVMASHLDDRPDHTNYLNWAVCIAHEVANAIAAHERSICADIAANQRDGEDITKAWKHCSRFIEQRIRARD